ncbi:MAG: hypothetical protein NT106_13260 [Candidatus Sumerlaeota bacterium]|nr:hypothetical protein [Candidatus Sumerlaeota bacterium]
MKKLNCYLMWLFIPAFVALCASSAFCAKETVFAKPETPTPTPVPETPTPTPVLQEVKWCILQWPPQVTLLGGQSFDVCGYVYEPGVTEASGQGAGIEAQAGVGPDGSSPVGNPSWIWVDANYQGDIDENDAYVANVLANLQAGTYDYCYRFRPSGGAWKYADLDGSANGYSAEQAGSFTILAPTPTPTSTPIPTPTPKPTASPTSTPVPTSTLTPTPTSSPTPTPGPSPTPIGFIQGRISYDKNDVGIADVKLLLFKDEKPQGGDGNIFREDLVTSTTSTSGGQGGGFTFPVYPPSSVDDKFLVAVDRTTLPNPLYMDVLEKGILPAQVNQPSPVSFKVADMITPSYLDQIIAHILVKQAFGAPGDQYDQYLDVNFDFGIDVADVIKLLKAPRPTPTPTPIPTQTPGPTPTPTQTPKGKE